MWFAKVVVMVVGPAIMAAGAVLTYYSHNYLNALVILLGLIITGWAWKR